jgi:CrcB protein
MYPLLAPVGFLAVGIGAALGAWLRWLLALAMNGSSGFPVGTLAANLGGGYVIGVMVALVSAHPEWPEWVRLACITGFLGGLTTFSTFSAETVGMIERGSFASALAYSAISLLGSLALTAAGLFTVRALQ